jgi:hypothetical protein
MVLNKSFTLNKTQQNRSNHSLAVVYHSKTMIRPALLCFSGMRLLYTTMPIAPILNRHHYNRYKTKAMHMLTRMRGGGAPTTESCKCPSAGARRRATRDKGRRAQKKQHNPTLNNPIVLFFFVGWKYMVPGKAFKPKLPEGSQSPTKAKCQQIPTSPAQAHPRLIEFV